MCYLIKAHPNEFLTHHQNRGGILLSPHNAHENAAGIKATGADLSLVGHSWAMELPVKNVEQIVAGRMFKFVWVLYVYLACLRASGARFEWDKSFVKHHLVML